MCQWYRIRCLSTGAPHGGPQRGTNSTGCCLKNSTITVTGLSRETSIPKEVHVMCWLGPLSSLIQVPPIVSGFGRGSMMYQSQGGSLGVSPVMLVGFSEH